MFARSRLVDPRTGSNTECSKGCYQFTELTKVQKQYELTVLGLDAPLKQESKALVCTFLQVCKFSSMNQAPPSLQTFVLVSTSNVCVYSLQKSSFRSQNGFKNLSLELKPSPKLKPSLQPLSKP